MVTYKTEKDIKLLKEGGRLHARILKQLCKSAVAGASGKMLDEIAHNLITQAGDKPAFLDYRPEGATWPYPASICLSLNDEIVHGIPQGRVLKEGDVVSIDLGLIHKGMVTDAAVTVAVGKINQNLQRLISSTKEALRRGIEKATAGNTTGDIGFAIQSVAVANGFGIAEGLSGHGVGYAVHEDPYVPNTGVPGEGMILKEGMVIAIEPMFVTGSGAVTLDTDGYTFRTEDGGCAAHFEHTVAITKTGPLVLTA